jgi:defect in organelle trafficking protein DotD
MSKFKCGVVVSALIAVALSGCAVPKQPDGPDTEAQARRVILERVDSAVAAQRELAAAQSEAKATASRRQAALEADEVDIDYQGRVQPLLEALAVRYGYKFVEAGRRGGQDLPMVNIRCTKKGVIPVLEDLGLQIDKEAQIVLDKDIKAIRLVYKQAKV